MKLDRFNQVVKNRVEKCVALLVPKGEEYTRGGDRLHNFKVAARVEGISPERALRGMDLKHRVSLMDIVDDLDRGVLPAQKVLDEKINDSINYLLLLEALITDKRDAAHAALDLIEREVAGVAPKKLSCDDCIREGCVNRAKGYYCGAWLEDTGRINAHIDTGSCAGCNEAAREKAEGTFRYGTADA